MINGNGLVFKMNEISDMSSLPAIRLVEPNPTQHPFIGSAHKLCCSAHLPKMKPNLSPMDSPELKRDPYLQSTC